MLPSSNGQAEGLRDFASDLEAHGDTVHAQPLERNARHRAPSGQLCPRSTRIAYGVAWLHLFAASISQPPLDELVLMAKGPAYGVVDERRTIGIMLVSSKVHHVSFLAVLAKRRGPSCVYFCTDRPLNPPQACPFSSQILPPQSVS